MNPSLIGGIAFLSSAFGVLVGGWLRARLPQEHLDGGSKDVIKLGIGLTATRLLVIDRTLARYVPEAAAIRVELKQVLDERVQMIWPTDSARPLNLDPTTAGQAPRVERLVLAIRSLDTSDELKAALPARTASLAEDVLEARWTAMAGTGSSVSMLFLVVVMSWLTLIFAVYGMFADNHTAISVLVVCAFSIGSALFLVLELDAPFDGLIKVAADPLRYALAHMNR